MPYVIDRPAVRRTSRAMESTQNADSPPEYKFDGYEIVSQEKVALTPVAQDNKTVVRTVGGARHG